MNGYLGETPVNWKEVPEFANYTEKDWAMYFISRFGQIDGEHHKAWVLDQVSRILLGTEIIVVLAKWENGNSEYRVWLDTPSEPYNKWVKEMTEEDEWEEPAYSYDTGIAP